MINEKIFDGQLITVGDYTVQGKITGTQYKAFLQNAGDNDENAIAGFEEQLTSEIENWLMQRDENKANPQSTYKVGDLQLAFDNDKLMDLLKKRALALRKGNFEQVRKI